MKRTIPIAALAMLLATATLLAQTSIPNTIKYKDSSIAGGKGSAGDAQLESRTLLNRDGSADVELTANGVITKVQIQAGNDTDNFNHLENDGSASFRAEGLARGSTVAIHANVDAGARTEVVRTEEIVKLRPDLAVSLSAPQQVPPNASVTIRADIAEKNGDSGARANCRLVVDGTEVDRAENIWVDAGGNVQCAFVHAFAAYGMASVAVFVDTTDPADWDDANNSATAQVEVAKQVGNWAVHALVAHESSQSHSTSPLWDTHNDQLTFTQRTDLTAWIYDPVDLTSLAIGYDVSSEGRPLYGDEQVELDEFRAHPWRDETCASSRSSWPGVRVCKTANFLLIEISHSTTDAVYHSWGYNWYADPNHPLGAPAPGVYDRILVREENTALIGESVQWDLRVTDGAGARWHDQPFLPSLTRSESQMNNPMRCGFARRYGFEVCSSYQSQTIRREGWMSR